MLAHKKEDTEYDIFVMYNELSKETQKAFDSIAKINWVYVDRKVCENFPHTERFPEIVYYRLMIYRLVSKYDKVIWSDVDVLFRGDLQGVYNTNLDGYFWGGVAETKNVPKMPQYAYFEENKNPCIFYSGFMLINSKKMRKDNIWDRFCSIVNDYYNKIRFFDLELLNICCYPIKCIPIEYCMTEAIYAFDDFNDSNEWKLLRSIYDKDELIQARRTAKIIHYNGSNLLRIWERPRRQIPDYYWEFLEKSPFFNLPDYYPKRTLLGYVLYILQCIGGRIFPVKN